MKLGNIQKMEDLINLVNEIGFLPMFCNPLPGYSVEECTPPELMFEGKAEGPWEWREELVENKVLIYGKFFGGRTGFISLSWFPDFANYRRNGYDFDARWNDGLVNYQDKRLYELLMEYGSCPAPELRRLAGVKKGKTSAFETAVTRLQMRAYVLPVRCIFARNRQGEKYGYGVTSFDLAERWLGDKLCTSAYKTDPAESYEKIFFHLVQKLGEQARAHLEKLIQMR